MASVGRKQGRDDELTNSVHAISADSGASCRQGTGVHHPGSLDRRGAAAGSLRTVAEGGSPWGRRPDRGGIRRGPGSAPQGSARASEPPAVPGDSGSSGVDTEGRRQSAPTGDPDPGGQACPTGGGSPAHPDLRTGLLRVFVRVPSGERGPRRAARVVGARHGTEGSLAGGCRYPWIL